MQTHEVGATMIETTVLGFGCAGVFRVSSKKERLALLEEAFESGFRHFDTAPMYGMGQAESELKPFLRRHRDDITVTTKFGITIAPLGRVAGIVQSPIRRVLASRPSAGATMQSVGAGPHSGMVGRALYRATGYTSGAARRSLDRSLGILGTDHVDILALHDPLIADLEVAERSDLVASLQAEVDRGRIRSWSIATHHLALSGPGSKITAMAPILQFRDHLLAPPTDLPTATGVVTYGSISSVVPSALALQRLDPTALDYFKASGGSSDTIANLGWALLRDAVARTSSGVVLYATTKRDRIREAAASVALPMDSSEATALEGLVQRIVASDSPS
jgi:D-threo-aldose 1-dehydrogenase